MQPFVPQSHRDSDPTDPGYRPVRGSRAYAFLETLDAAISESDLDDKACETISELLPDYIADVLDQYTCRYYDDQDPLLIGEVIYRFSRLYEILIQANLPDLNPQPGTVEGVFDDFWAMDGETFCAKYNISEFYKILCAKAEPALVKDDYTALAQYLSPGDPVTGFETIDAAILANLRRRQALRNVGQLFSLAAALFVAASAMFAGLVLINSLISPGELGRRFGDHSIVAALLDAPWQLAALALLGAVPGAYCLHSLAEVLRSGCRGGNLRCDQPAEIRDWLEANEKKHSLDYWHEIHWPLVKLKLHSTEVLGFRFYRSQPLRLADYESLLNRRIKLRRKDYWTQRLEGLVREMRTANS